MALIWIRGPDLSIHVLLKTPASAALMLNSVLHAFASSTSAPSETVLTPICCLQPNIVSLPFTHQLGVTLLLPKTVCVNMHKCA